MFVVTRPQSLLLEHITPFKPEYGVVLCIGFLAHALGAVGEGDVGALHDLAVAALDVEQAMHLAAVVEIHLGAILDLQAGAACRLRPVFAISHASTLALPLVSRQMRASRRRPPGIE